MKASYKHELDEKRKKKESLAACDCGIIGKASRSKQKAIRNTVEELQSDVRWGIAAVQLCIRNYLKMLVRRVGENFFALLKYFRRKSQSCNLKLSGTWNSFRTICVCLDFKYFSKNYASLCKNFVYYCIIFARPKKLSFNAMRNELHLWKHRIYNFSSVFIQ